VAEVTIHRVTVEVDDCGEEWVLGSLRGMFGHEVIIEQYGQDDVSGLLTGLATL
jgi:hypothetical protein